MYRARRYYDDVDLRGASSSVAPTAKAKIRALNLNFIFGPPPNFSYNSTWWPIENNPLATSHFDHPLLGSTTFRRASLVLPTDLRRHESSTVPRDGCGPSAGR